MKEENLEKNSRNRDDADRDLQYKGSLLPLATSTAPSSLLLHPISAPFARLLSSAAVVLWPARSPHSAGRLLITFFIVMHAAAAPIITGKGIRLSRRLLLRSVH